MEFCNSRDYQSDPRTIALKQHAEFQKELSNLFTAVQNDPQTAPEIQDGLGALSRKAAALDRSLKSFLPAPFYNHVTSPKSHTLAARTFGVEELLEMILGHLDQSSLSNALCVCRAWANAIKSSGLLLHKLYLLYPSPCGIFRIIPPTHRPKEISTSIRFHAKERDHTVLDLHVASILVQITDSNRFVNTHCHNLLLSEQPSISAMEAWSTCVRPKDGAIPAATYLPRRDVTNVKPSLSDLLRKTKGKWPFGELVAPILDLKTSSPWASPGLQRFLHDRWPARFQFDHSWPVRFSPYAASEGNPPENVDRSRRASVGNRDGLSVGDLYSHISKIRASHTNCPWQLQHEIDPATGELIMYFTFTGTVNLERDDWARRVQMEWETQKFQAMVIAYEAESPRWTL